METLRVCEEPSGWTLRLGDVLMQRYPSRTHAMAHAAWLARQLGRCGTRAEVRLLPLERRAAALN